MKLHTVFLAVLMICFYGYTQNEVKEDYLKEDPGKQSSQMKRAELFIKYLEQLQIKIKTDLAKSKRTFEIKDVKEILNNDAELKGLYALYKAGRLSLNKLSKFEMYAISKVSTSGIPKEKRKALEEWDSYSSVSNKKILILRANEGKTLNFLEKTLTDLGYDVTVKVFKDRLAGSTREYQQIWLISGFKFKLSDTEAKSEVKKYKKLLESGKGLYILADNDPYLKQANMIAQGLHGAKIEGSYKGQQMIDIFELKNNENLSSEDKVNWAYDHELLSGIYSIYEGITISNITASDQLDIVLRASDGKPLVSTSKNEKELIIYDCGFTRIYDEYMKDPYNTRLWIKNVVTYLSGHKRSDLKTLISQ